MGPIYVIVTKPPGDGNWNRTIPAPSLVARGTINEGQQLPHVNFTHGPSRQPIG